MSTTESAARIRRIETGLRGEARVWSASPPVGTIEERLAFYAIPGLSVAVFADGEITWASGYGMNRAGANDAVTSDTIFQAASISKHVTALAVLRLVQDGTLGLDGDVNRSLTSWQIPANGDWQPRITLRQLLGHTAGLVSNWYPGYLRGAPTPTLLQTLNGDPPANTPPVHAVALPGTINRYSGSHYSVVQQLLVDVTGQPFPGLMRDLVLTPLAMSNSDFDQTYPDRRTDTTAHGHYVSGEPIGNGWQLLPEMAAAGLWTTPSDLAKIAMEIINAFHGRPTAFLSKEMVDQLLTPQIFDGYGLGTVLMPEHEGSRRFGHGGGNVGYECLTTAYLELGTGVVMMTNSEAGSTIFEELLGTITREYAWPMERPERTATSIDAGTYASLAGEYELRDGVTITVRAEAGELTLLFAAQPPVELVPRSKSAFFARPLNSEITFEQGEEGDVVALVLKQEWQETRAVRRS
jgi:CubicO group peptidase (beta-lactamase class C family)